MMIRRLLTYLLLLSVCLPLSAEKPDWINRIPFTEDAFWGVGEGSSLEEAQVRGSEDILMQLSSRVRAAVSMEYSNQGGEIEVLEELDAYFDSNSLRGAELEDQYSEDDRFWALMKYCDDCGDMLIHSALSRYEDQYDYETEALIELIKSEIVADAVQVERRLKDLQLEDYHSEDISVQLDGDNLVILILNFLPDDTQLTPGQISGLEKVSRTLLEELETLDYQELEVIGHANPTGVANENDALIRLSRNRAETMASFLKEAGISVDTIGWRGGDETIRDVSTPEGRGLNRRVEIVIHFPGEEK